MAMWMLYAVVVAALLAGAAAAVEGILRSWGVGTRWAWVAALGGSWIVPVVAWFRPAPAAPVVSAEGTAWASALELMMRGEAASSGAAAGIIDLDPALAWAWAVSAALGVAVLVGAYLRLRHRTFRWPRARMAGVPVRVSEGFGPAVLGLVSPSIVLPRWVFALPALERDLILRHEEEHQHARDTLVLAGAALATTLAPWNAALWWQLRRLRMAVELDCDRRVLRRGVSPRAYAALLLEVGERTVATPLPAAALAEPPSFLERRLTMIANGTGRGSKWGMGMAAAVAIMLGVGACETPAPTGLNDAAPPAPETVIATLSPVVGPDGRQPLVFVDGEELEGMPGEMDAAEIARVEVIKGDAAVEIWGERAKHGVVQIYTKGSTFHLEELPSKEPAGGTLRSKRIPLDGRMDVKDDTLILRATLSKERAGAGATISERRPGATGGSFSVRRGTLRKSDGATLEADSIVLTAPTDPVIYVDGKAWSGAVDGLSALAIESVEVLKGAAAAGWGEDARERGVILVTTKR